MTTTSANPSIHCQFPGCGARLVMVRPNVVVCPNEPYLYAHGKSRHFDAATFRLMSRELDKREAFAKLPLMILADENKSGRMGVKLYFTNNLTPTELPEHYELFAQASTTDFLRQTLEPPLTSDCLLGKLDSNCDKCYWFLKPPVSAPWLLPHERVALETLAAFSKHKSLVGASVAKLADDIWDEISKTTKSWATAALKMLKKLGYAEPAKSAGDRGAAKPTRLWRITDKGKFILKQEEQA